MVESLKHAEVGRRVTWETGRGLVPVHFHHHRHWLIVLVITCLTSGIWEF